MKNGSAAPSLQTVRFERTYDGSVDDIWDLWTTKDGFESWWGPEGFRAAPTLLYGFRRCAVNEQDRSTSGRQEGPDEPFEAPMAEDEPNTDQTARGKGHGPLKGTDTPATTFAEDLEKAQRNTM